MKIGRCAKTSAYLFTILCSLFSIRAEGAKLCREVGARFSYQRAGNYFWARGNGCKGTVYSNANVEYNADLNAVMATCNGSISFAGTSSCWTSNATAPTAKGFHNGQHCWCKLLWPIESQWVFVFTSDTAANCSGAQVNDCTLHCSYSKYGNLLNGIGF